MRDGEYQPDWQARWLDIHRELSLVADRKERRAIEIEGRRFGAGFLALLWLWFMSDHALAEMIEPHFIASLPVPSWLGSVLWIITHSIVRIGVFLAWLWLTRRQIQRRVRTALQKRGYAVCVGCGYDLRGTTEPRCPECGTAFDPTTYSHSKPSCANEQPRDASRIGHR